MTRFTFLAFVALLSFAVSGNAFAPVAPAGRVPTTVSATFSGTFFADNAYSKTEATLTHFVFRPGGAAHVRLGIHLCKIPALQRVCASDAKL